MARQERWLRTEAPVRQNWPKIEGPIDNYGEDWGGVSAPYGKFYCGPRGFSSGTDLFAGLLSDSSSGGSSDVAQPTETESSDEVGENNTFWEEDSGDS